MKKQFIPYELALELKELGFDEECFGSYQVYQNKVEDFITLCPTTRGEGWRNSEGEEARKLLDSEYYISVALWQQAFDWFREKYELCSEVYYLNDYYWFDLEHINFGESYRNNGKYLTYEEARLECLKKLIEILKNEN